jgi:hypothetical protein
MNDGDKHAKPIMLIILFIPLTRERARKAAGGAVGILVLLAPR